MTPTLPMKVRGILDFHHLKSERQFQWIKCRQVSLPETTAITLLFTDVGTVLKVCFTFRVSKMSSGPLSGQQWTENKEVNRHKEKSTPSVPWPLISWLLPLHTTTSSQAFNFTNYRPVLRLIKEASIIDTSLGCLTWNTESRVSGNCTMPIHSAKCKSMFLSHHLYIEPTSTHRTNIYI